MEKIVERKLIGRVEVTPQATPEEKAGIIATLVKGGLVVFTIGNILYIRSEDDRTNQLQSHYRKGGLRCPRRQHWRVNMRHSYPLIFCVSEDAYSKLLGGISSLDVIPDEIWSNWEEPPMVKSQISVPYGFNYDRFIRQAPSKSRGV